MPKTPAFSTKIDPRRTHFRSTQTADGIRNPHFQPPIAPFRKNPAPNPSAGQKNQNDETKPFETRPAILVPERQPKCPRGDRFKRAATPAASQRAQPAGGETRTHPLTASYCHRSDREKRCNRRPQGQCYVPLRLPRPARVVGSCRDRLRADRYLRRGRCSCYPCFDRMASACASPGPVVAPVSGSENRSARPATRAYWMRNSL